MSRRIKVLIVDDSVSVQHVLREILERDPEIEVIGMASDPYEAVAQIAQNLPDVITLDIEMPRMDGLTFLRKLMQQHPIPVVVISSVAGVGSENGIKALKLGAKEVITKPKLTTNEELEEYRIQIIDAVKASAQIGRRYALRVNRGDGKTENSGNLSLKETQGFNQLSDKVILIGASTGGTEVISRILKGFRSDLPGILIVQHMPGEFTKAFASRLNRECDLQVKEAEHGDFIKNGCVYIANGYNHLELDMLNGNYICKLQKGELVNRHRPSVDVLFNSARKFQGKNITAILLTGMGTDGARGLLKLNEIGAQTFAQDEKSSVIFGMPKEAIKLNAAQKIGTPEELVSWINSLF